MEKRNGKHIQYLQIGERTITIPIGYRKKVVLSKKGRTTARNLNQINSTIFTAPINSKQKLVISQLYTLRKQVYEKQVNVHLFTMLTITSNRPTSYEFVLHIIRKGLYRVKHTERVFAANTQENTITDTSTVLQYNWQQLKQIHCKYSRKHKN